MALELEEKGYDFIKSEVAEEVDSDETDNELKNDNMKFTTN